MIKPTDYTAAVAALLEQQFPGEPVYPDLVPENFNRPSNEVEIAKITLMQHPGTDAISVTTEVLIRTFVVVDAYHNSQYDALYERITQIMELFAPGFIRVADRAPKVVSCLSPVTGRDYAEVRVTLELMHTRVLDTTELTAPIMQTLGLSVEMPTETDKE